jgi:hypothetical protein
MTTGDSGVQGMSQQIDFSIDYSIVGPTNDGAGVFSPLQSSVSETSNMPSMAADINTMVANAGAGNPPSTDYSQEQMALVFQDEFGANYSVPAVSNVFSTAPAELKANLEASLKSLPNQKVSDLTVEILTQANRANAYTCPGGGACAKLATSIKVSYHADVENGNLVGSQNLLQCPSAYGCSQQGCRPFVKMPFAVRYVGHEAAVDYTNAITNNAGATVSSGSTVNMVPFNYNGNAHDAHAAKKAVLLSADSDPRLPMGMRLNNQVDGIERFDGRIEIIVIDPQDGIDDLQDKYYYKVGFYNGLTDNADGKTGSSSYETDEVRYLPSELTPANQKLFHLPTDATSFKITGFTAAGPLPAVGFSRVPLREFPGAYLNFASANMVADGMQRIFEIAYKLPKCAVSVYEGIGPSTDLKVGTHVESIECSGRGSCNYDSGECSCFEGYYGLSCAQRTTLI